jgi:Rieske 2Fe-2S family protein
MTSAARVTEIGDRNPGQAKSAYLSNRRLYWDTRVFELEMARVLPDSWLFVCDVAEIASPGDYVTTTIGYEPVVVLRDDGDIRAYLNVCPHRGSTLVRDTGNCGRTLDCPYHGWRFRLDGRLAATPFRRYFDPEQAPMRGGLKEVAVGVWERFVFVNCSGTAPGLLASLEDLPDVYRDYRMADAVVTFRGRERYDVNWKVWADISFDSYHLPFVHRRTIGDDLDLRSVTMRPGPLHTSHGTARLADRIASSMPARQHADRVLFSYLYPSLQISAQPDGSVFLVSAAPDAPDSVVVDVVAYAPAGTNPSAAPDAGSAAETTLYDVVRQEDVDQCRKVMATLRSTAPVTGPVNLLSLPEGHFHAWLRHMYATHAEYGRSLGIPDELLHD